MDNKSIKKISMLLMLILGLIVGSVACEERKKSNDSVVSESTFEEEGTIKQFEFDEEEPLIIFYDGDAHIIQNFMYQYPNIKLKTYRIYFGKYREGIIEEASDMYGEPDIILACNGVWGGNNRVENWYKEGSIADIREFLTADNSIVESDYVPGTFTLLDNGEAVLGLPLSWEKTSIIVRESKWKDSELSYLAEEYTGRELYNALYAELKKYRQEDEFFFALSYSMMESLYEVCRVEQENGEFVIDEEVFELLYDFFAMREIADINADRGTENHPIFDPDIFGGNYFACMLKGAPQVVSVYAKSAAIELFGEDIHMYWIPVSDAEDEYIGEVVDFALVGGKSTRKQQAIRLMMDMPIEIVNQPYVTNYPKTSSPVNIDRALELLEFVDSQEKELTIASYTSSEFDFVQQQKLSEEEKNKIRDMITGMTVLHLDIKNSEFYSIYSSYLQSTVESGYIDYKQCYFEYMRALNPNSEKWNLSPEEIEAYLSKENGE